MSEPQIRLCLVFHNHQPIGNFDDVIEQAFQQSYLPFLEVVESYSSIQFSLHTSGPLLLWLNARHPEYVERLSALVAEQRVEILGGAFYEPILTMIPSRDRRGQVSRFCDWLEQRFDTQVRGMWIPERVWEPSLVGDLAASGIQYTVLDDFHFRCAGLGHEQLLGSYVTEDQGQTLRIFPGSEQLRYTIPFQEPQATMDYLREIASQHPRATVVFADDGEKFGTWPETFEHVYTNGWLSRFLDALVENQDWLVTTTLGEAVHNTIPLGKVYLPAASYREMTEWSLPVARQVEYEHIAHDLESDWRWPKIRKFVRGGFWRNFKHKYSETDEMYARMMYVSDRLEQAEHQGGGEANLLDQARDHLYRGQCNCAYWHGAFGGVYLPHLRNAVYKHLIIADNLIDKATGSERFAVEARDFNFDQRPEIRLANNEVVCWLRPSAGGQLYELDVRSIGHNLLATMNRRPEAYHEKIKRGQHQNSDAAASIHDRVVFKQENLDQMLIYDSSPRKSLIDHFWPADATCEQIANGQATELGDFVSGSFESTMRRNPHQNQVLMTRAGQVQEVPIKITKGVTLSQSGKSISIAYLLENLPPNHQFQFGIEFNFAGLPPDQDDRYFRNANQDSIGHLGETLDLPDCQQLGLVDQWLGIEIDLNWNQLGGLWAFPVQAVSQSESGFELVHQSVSVQPHWIVEGDADGRWAVKLEMAIQTKIDAMSMEQPPIPTGSF